MTELLQNIAKQYDIELINKHLDEFELYKNMLLEWNEKFNLTAITEPTDIAIKHFLDSLLLLKVMKIPNQAKLIDIGTGAGFPAIPLKIVRQDLRITLLDSLNKRLSFLKELSAKLDIDCELVHARAEDAAKDINHRERYDIVTSRAVSKLNVLTEYCLPYLNIGGTMLAMKGAEFQSELKDADNAIKVLGGEVEDVKEFLLPGGDKRSVVVINKVKATPQKYPRNSAQIKKKAL